MKVKDLISKITLHGSDFILVKDRLGRNLFDTRGPVDNNDPTVFNREVDEITMGALSGSIHIFVK